MSLDIATIRTIKIAHEVAIYGDQRSRMKPENK